MKKRLALSLAIFTSVFVIGGIYLIITIERTTSTLNNLIQLHRVEILREQLLMNVRKIQDRLAVEHTHSEEPLDSLAENMAQMENQANKCLECHHNAEIAQELDNLKGQISAYKEAFNRYLTARSDRPRMEERVSKTLKLGHKLVNMLHDMTALTHAKLETRTQTSLAKISDMKILIFIVIVLGPIIAIGIAIFFAQGLTGPLSVLLQATRKLKSGDLSFRIQALPDEFGEMASAFNEMASALNEHLHKMQRAEQMTTVGEMATRLIHEIKNPLAGIKGAMQVIQDGIHITEEEHAVIAQVVGEVQRIELLMKSLLNFAKPPKPQLLQVNMNDILEASFNPSLPYAFSALAEPTAIKVVKRFDPDLPLIMADPMEMQQVFLNLLMNAVHAMPVGGTLTVSTCENAAAQEIQVEIADTGKGINDEIREKIFQPFFTTKSKGTGLGLAISKQFIEMHGGNITVENNPAGGTIFRVSLPCA